MSTRQKQIASTLQRAAEQVLARGLADPRVKGLITVTGVEVSADGRRATVSVSILPEEAEDLTMHGLRHAAKHIRHHVSNLVAVHPMPQMDFKLDKSLKKQAAVLEALAKVQAERAARGTPEAGETVPSPDAGPDGGAGGGTGEAGEDASGPERDAGVPS